MNETPPETFTFTTKLWQRSQNSYATTVPQSILALRNAPVENGQVDWEIDTEEGTLSVEFSEADTDE